MAFLYYVHMYEYPKYSVNIYRKQIHHVTKYIWATITTRQSLDGYEWIEIIDCDYFMYVRLCIHLWFETNYIYQ